MDSFVKILLEDDMALQTSQTKPLVNAIVNRHPISFMYTGPRKGKDSVLSGKRMNGEAVALGLSKKGNLIIRVFIPSPNVSKKGFNKTNWRTFMVSRMRNIQIHDDRMFDLNRPQFKSGDDDSMTVTYVTSDTTKKPEIKPIKKVKVEPTQPQVEPTKPEPTSKLEPITKPEVKPTTVEPTQQELPQPKPDEKPSVNPIQTPQDNINKEKDLYKKKESDWINKQKEIGGNIKPGQGTRERFKKEIEKELPQPKPDEKPNENPEDNKLQESLKRIKHLMF
jgi:hypothetical protein